MLRRIRRIRQDYPRYQDALLSNLGVRPAAALRSALADGYGKADVRADIMAGLVVGIVALPLSMALAIASGVPPQHGLYTAMIGGALIALLGGSRTQVSGPTAAFVVLLVPVSEKYGVGGLMLASAMAGVMLMGLGLARMGRLIQYIPHPVTTGFTAGIAVVIATLQMKDFLGLTVEHMPDTWLEKVVVLAQALPTARWQDVLVGVTTLAILRFFPKLTSRVPAPLVALTFATVLVQVLHLDVATIGSKFAGGIPQVPPMPGFPWDAAGADGKPIGLSVGLLRELFPSAFAITMLGAIESLLSAVVSDGMAGTRHDPDAELFAQGVGNVVAPFFGGFAATGAIARTATNIRAGARSPLASVTHAIFVFLAVLVLAPLLSYLPMAALSALLLLVAWNMSDVKHFAHVLRVAPKSDVFVQLVCFTLTVLFDMVIAVTSGVVLAAFLFMRRMAEISGARLAEGEHPKLRTPLPKGVILYEVNGPLFFGAAEKAMGALSDIASRARVVILDVSSVPAMDATGLVNLESTLDKLEAKGVEVLVTGLQEQPLKLLRQAGLFDSEHPLPVFDDVEHAVAEAGRLSAAATA